MKCIKHQMTLKSVNNMLNNSHPSNYSAIYCENSRFFQPFFFISFNGCLFIKWNFFTILEMRLKSITKLISTFLNHILMTNKTIYFIVSLLETNLNCLQTFSIFLRFEIQLKLGTFKSCMVDCVYVTLWSLNGS